MKVMKVNDWKLLRSNEVNYNFNLKTGRMETYGKTKDEDAVYSPYGPFILDCEISTKCAGPNGKLCSYCYKSNTSNGKNMSFETFQKVVQNINQAHQLTQVAFGLGATGEENPDLWKMCEWLRSIGIIPNGTVASISDETADRIAKWFGACAISYHQDKDLCYDNIKKLTDRGMTQCNMHYVIYEENYEETLSVFNDVISDPRLSKLNALVLLSLKQKGRAENNSNFHPLSQEKFTNLVKVAFEKGIRLGFDSCSCPKFEKSIVGMENEKQLLQLAEGCEQSLFSSYVNVDGMYYPCSFTECQNEWSTGIDISNDINFLKDVWFSQKVNETRLKLLNNCRNCPYYVV